jgi:hypothetical protein
MFSSYLSFLCNIGLSSPVDRGWMILGFSQTELFSLGVVPVSALNGKIIKAKSLFMFKAVANQ